MWSHNALIYNKTLAQSLCTFGSLIHDAAGGCRECGGFGPAQLPTITRSDCKISKNNSVGSGGLWELGPF